MKSCKRCLLGCLCLLLVLCAFSAAAADAPPYRGVDVSRWQGAVDWSAVKASGVEFACIRCYSYRKDANFEANYAGAAAQEIPVGAYVYMYATTEAQAIAEAQGALTALNGRPLALPLFLDVEDSSVTCLGRKTLTDLMLIELYLFETAGYRTGFYTSQNYVSAYMDESRLAGFDRWIARWTCYTTEKNPKTFTFDDQDPNNNPPDCDVWQFSNGGNGSVFGVESVYVDLDYCYTDYLHLTPAAPHEPQDPSAHTHSFEAQVIPPTCTEAGRLVQTCTLCGEVISKTYSPECGHTAPDENGRCALCGTVLADAEQAATGGRICPLCGKPHKGLLGWFVLILHTVLAYFR